MGATRILICKSTAYAAKDGGGTATHPNELAEGAIGVFEEDNSLLDNTDTPATAGSRKIYIAVGRESTFGAYKSPLIDGNYVTGWTGESYAAPVKQLTHVGYNGTSGTLEVNAGEDYTLKVIETTPAGFALPRFTYQIRTESTDTGYTIAKALVDQVNAKNGSVLVSQEDVVYADVTTNGNETAFGTARTISVTKNSTAASLSGAGHNVAAGDYIRIGGSGGSYPVFKVVSVATNDIVLDRPYQGATASGVAGYELDTITSYGIFLTAKSYGVHFRVALSADGFGDTTDVTYTTPFDTGSGTYDQVYALEKKYKGYDGFFSNIDTYVKTPDWQSVSGATYDLYTLSFSTVGKAKHGMDGYFAEPQSLIIAMPASATSQATFETRMNDWTAGCPLAFAAVTL